MTRAELAAEVLRIHDLIAAEPEPSTPEEWHAICQAVAAVAESCLASKVTAMRTPQPRVVDGIGLCSVHCAHYHPLDGISREHSSSGQCLKVAMATLLPWQSVAMSVHNRSKH